MLRNKHSWHCLLTELAAALHGVQHCLDFFLQAVKTVMVMAMAHNTMLAHAAGTSLSSLAPLQH
jgi:hypothetical protein